MQGLEHAQMTPHFLILSREIYSSKPKLTVFISNCLLTALSSKCITHKFGEGDTWFIKNDGSLNLLEFSYDSFLYL